MAEPEAVSDMAGLDVAEVRRICARLRDLGVSERALDPVYKAAMEAEIEQTRTNSEDWP